MSARTSRWADSAPFQTYPVRVMLGLVASLSLVLVLVHLPFHFPTTRVGWSAHPPAEQIVVDEIALDESEEEEEDASAKTKTASAPPVTNFQPLSSETSPPTATAEESSGSAPSAQDSTRPRRYEKIQSVTELGLTDHTPYIVGGVGSLYLHIKYPQKALEEGIEGRLALEFTVQSDGSVADLEVVDSLHPLCDSAAVEGVRGVQFVPAKHNGKPVPVRLHLPVQFRLTAATSATLSEEPSP